MTPYLQYFGIVIVGCLSIGLCLEFARSRRWVAWLVFGVVATISATFLLRVTACSWWGDYESAYYPAGRAVATGLDGLYRPSCVAGFVNVPLVAMVFAPLARLPYDNSIYVFTALGAAAILAAYLAFLKLLRISGWRSLALACAFAMNGPLFYSVKEGNTSHFFLLVIVGLLFLLQRRKEFLLGAVLAASAVIKIPFALLGAYFLLRGRWRVLAGMAVTLAAVGVVSVLTLGLDLHLHWFQRCVAPYAGKPMAAFNVQSVDGFLARLFTDNQVLNWSPLVMDSRFTVARSVVVGSVVLAITVVFLLAGRPRTIADEYLEISCALCALLLIAPVSWTHYYVMLILPAGLYVAGKLPFPTGRFWNVLMVLAIVAVSPPMLRMNPGDPMMRLIAHKLLYSHYFLGAFGMLAILLMARWQVSRKSGSHADPTAGPRSE